MHMPNTVAALTLVPTRKDNRRTTLEEELMRQAKAEIGPTPIPLEEHQMVLRKYGLLETEVVATERDLVQRYEREAA